MEKLKYLPLGLFTLYCGKMLVFGNFTWESALVLAVMGSISGYYEWKSQEKITKDLADRIQKTNDALLLVAKNQDELKNHVASLKLGNQIRPASKFGA